MAYNREKYAGTRQYVAEAREKLLNKELLSERECLRLSKEIEKLPDIEILPIEEDITLNIDELFNEFREYAGRSKNKLEGILAIISEGRIPNSEERKEFDEIIDALCERYNLVCMVAKKELLDEEMPSEGSSINDFYNAIKTSKSAIRKSQINGLKEILQRFISVQSLVANLTSALEPFQKDAKSLLERINNGEVNTIDEITEEVAGPQLFMRALECDDLNTDEGNDMLDCLEENFSYPSRVTRGLTSKSYFIPEGVASTASADFENGNDLCHKSKTLKELQQIKNVELTNIPEIKEEVKHEKVEEESDNKLENKEKQKSAFSIAVEEAGVALQEKEFGILSSEISSSETKKLSASVFTNDLRKGNVKALKNIIQQIDKFPMLSAELLRIRYKMSENIAEGSLGFLLKKG